MSSSIGSIGPHLHTNNSGVQGTGGIPSPKPPQSAAEKLFKTAKNELANLEGVLMPCDCLSISYDGSHEQQIIDIRNWLMQRIENYENRPLDVRNVGTEVPFPQLIANNNALMEIFLNPLISQPDELDKLEKSQLGATLLFATRLRKELLVHRILNDKDDNNDLKFCGKITNNDIENSLKLAAEKNNDSIVSIIVNCLTFKGFSKQEFCRCYEIIVISKLIKSKEAIKAIKNEPQFIGIILNNVAVENRNFLMPDECEKLIKQNKEGKTKAICNPIRAVVLYDKGKSIKGIAKSIFLKDNDEDTLKVWSYIIDYASRRKQESEKTPIKTLE